MLIKREFPDQTARMRTLIRTFAVRIWHKGLFTTFAPIIFSVLTPADEENHINKHNFTVPFVCGARDLGEALRRIAEGAAMIRTKGLAGTGTCLPLFGPNKNK